MIRSLVLYCAVLASLASASTLRGGYASHLSEELEGCSYSATCSAGGVSGVCLSVSSGCCKGTTSTGLCPGNSDIKCCTNNPCSTPYGSGTCIQTSLCASRGGKYYSGYCTGPSDIRCCIEGGPVDDGEYGIDVSSLVSKSTYDCMKSSGFTYVIPRGYRSTASVDSNVCGNLQNAQSAGISKRDVYHFPKPTSSKSATTQVGELVDHLNSNCRSAFNGRIWLDIEGAQYWLGSYSSNKAWYEEFVDACKVHNVACGIYTNKNQWIEIFGSSSYSYGSSLPLWYARYDNNPSFSDFSSFGGWSKPHAKQYAGDVTLCSAGVDKNWAPEW